MSKSKLPPIVTLEEWIRTLTDEEVSAFTDELPRLGVPDISREQAGEIKREIAADLRRDGALSRSCRYWKIAAAAEAQLRRRGARVDGSGYDELVKFAGHISILSPRAKLPVKVLGAVVAEWWVNGYEWWAKAFKVFHQTCPLPCGTPEHNRAEFYNLWFHLVRQLKLRTRTRYAPTYLVVFVALRMAFRPDELERASALSEFNRLFEQTGKRPDTAYSHARRMLRHIIAQVGRALTPYSRMGDGWRRRTLALNPLIAHVLRSQRRSAHP